MSALTYGASAILALAFVAGLIGVVFFTAILFERAAQAHMRGMDRVRKFDQWCHDTGQPCRFCGSTYVCDEGCSRLDKWDTAPSTSRTQPRDTWDAA